MKNSIRQQIISASSLEGTDVRTPADESIGDIKDIMIDLQSGEISYLVLSVNTGFLNLQNKYFAVPLGAFNFDNLRDDYTSKNVLVLDVSKERLENSPGFDKDNWPSHPDSTFVDSVNSYYGMDDSNESSRFDLSGDPRLDDARSSDSSFDDDDSGLGESRRDDMRHDNIRL
ncbi:PRC-barrel domain-containing protein [Aquiflexum sp.]|uniref:PRC-barrel domain-containing protein n=1 Tax=Aquiflexum sp. TaxID=1872584 RepID=UPI0035947C8A